MTPAARVAAAATVLDDILNGRSAEQALKAWGRASRFAGSKDRAALRDLVFDALRRRASCAALGGGLHGRGLMLGLGLQQGWNLAEVFSGIGHAPPVLTEAERAQVRSPPELSVAEALDVPAWMVGALEADWGEDAYQAMRALRDRAAVFVRVNQRRSSVAEAIVALEAEQITGEVHPVVPGCVEITGNARRLQQSQAYLSGLVDIQDASSQHAVARLTIPNGASVLDYCAGGGGKSLAIADQFGCTVTAHDIAPRRMADIAPRAQRAGVQIEVVGPDALRPDRRFDVVVADAPCSGSGTWRRNPEAKWALTSEKLQKFSALQREVLTAATRHLKPKGQLIYMTCSIFSAENDAVVSDFREENPTFTADAPLRLLPTEHWDGFYCHTLRLGENVG